MSYDKTKTFDRAEAEMDKMMQEQKALNEYWGGQFKDLTEILYMVMKDGTTFRIANQDKNINLSVGRLDEYLKGIEGKKYSVKEIDTVIHNHFKRPKFSSSDKKQYRQFKNFGFTGKFLMYSHLRKQVYEYEPDEKNK